MPRFKFPREFYIPAGWLKIEPKGFEGLIYITPAGYAGKPCAKGWIGKQAKPAFYYNFKTPEARAQFVEKWIADQIAIVAVKAEWKAKAAAERAKGHGLQVGHILVATWGYEQTNKDFYEVTALAGKETVEITPIAAAEVEQCGFMQGKVIPLPGEYKGKPMRKRGQPGGCVKITNYAWARLWEGKPEHYTAYA